MRLNQPEENRRPTLLVDEQLPDTVYPSPRDEPKSPFSIKIFHHSKEKPWVHKEAKEMNSQRSSVYNASIEPPR